MKNRLQKPKKEENQKIRQIIRKMKDNLFLIDIYLNDIRFIQKLIDFSYLYYKIINKELIYLFNLLYIKIILQMFDKIIIN